MAEQVRKERAQARERRRSLAAKPFEELDQSSDEDSQPTPLDAAKGIAAAAAAAAVAGALAGATKAFLERDSSPGEDETPDHEGMKSQAEPPEPEADAEEHAHEDDTDDDEPQEAPQPTAESEPQDDEEPEPEPDQPAAEADDDEPSAEHEDDSNGARGGSQTDAMRVVDQAREHLKNLVGADAESVSGIERENGNWSVTLEVVEMHRIPESTDILSSYSAVLDDDGGIVSLTRGRRYRRSQVEEV